MTPNHFLHEQVGGNFALEIAESTSTKQRWRYVQELVRHVWKPWQREWLPTLNVRLKWRKKQKDLQVGDVVIVATPECYRGQWPLGRVEKVFPGKDGRVRVARVQTGTKSLVRPLSKLCPLRE